MGINIRSEVFDDGGKIPQKYTCDDENVSPPLRWDTLPEHTLSFLIICEDPDAPQGTFTHWILYNISPDTHELPANIKKEENIENGMMQGINDFGYAGYGGPCPPSSTEHRFYFRIYALDTTLNLNLGAGREEINNAIWRKVLDKGELMGIYGR